jgi:hypothetical protein
LTYPEEGTPQGGVITPRTQKITSSFDGSFLSSGAPTNVKHRERGVDYVI